MQNLILYSDIMKLWVTKLKVEEAGKERRVENYEIFANFSLPRSKSKPWKETPTETFSWIFFTRN